MAWRDVGDWTDAVLASFVVLGFVLFWPIVSLGLALKAVNVAGHDRRQRLADERYRDREEQEKIDRQLRRGRDHMTLPSDLVRAVDRAAERMRVDVEAMQLVRGILGGTQSPQQAGVEIIAQLSLQEMELTLKDKRRIYVLVMPVER